jgi:integrase
MKHLSGLLLQNGKRKYLNADERARFLLAADAHDPDVRTFCGVLAFAGCRLSEALDLSADRVDLANGTLVFESLKKRRRGIFRAVPVLSSPELFDRIFLRLFDRVVGHCSTNEGLCYISSASSNAPARRHITRCAINVFQTPRRL